MAKGRNYAEGLVGPLDRSHYETQRQVALQTNDTNWQNLQNQYKNLTDQLKRKQERANIDYANGLVQVAENSLDRMSGANANMANRGLTSSGLNNLVDQADTAAKGEEILNLLGSAGDIAVKTAGQLASSNETFTNKASELAGDLAGALGDINAGDIAAQMNYNQGLADIGEAMEAREFNNEMEAAQRALNAANSGSGSSKEEDALEEIYKLRAIAEVLADDTLTKDQKTSTLRILYDINDANKAVWGYEDSKDAINKYNEQLEELEKAAKKADKKAPKKWVKTEKKKTTTLEPKGYKDSPFYENSAIGKANKTETPKNSDYIWEKVNSRGPTKEQQDLEEYIKNGLTYADLYSILYGN